MSKTAILAVVTLCSARMNGGQILREPHSFFREQVGLSDGQIESIDLGKAIAKVLPSSTPAEVFVFGAVYVKAAPEDYVKLAFDMNRLQRSPSYLGAGRFSDPPQLSDLQGFTLEPEDIRSLKNCKPGKCGLQLPAEAMQQLQEGLNWSEPHLATELNDRVRRMALTVIQRYQRDGNRILGPYRDSDRPFDVNAHLRSLLGRAQALPVYLPELTHYLLDYPNTKLAGVDSIFYWEKVDFGLKPTLRLNHAIAYQSAGPRGTADVVMVKQIYASHYFQLALDLTVCVARSGSTGDKGFYLISLKGSTQDGLTGFMGSLLRRIVVSRTRSAQEKLLINIKKTLEQRP